MLIIVMFCLYPHKSVKIWNVNTLSKSVALSMMVACILTSIELGPLILISIALGCTSMDGCTPTSNTSSSSTSLCATYVLTNCCFTPSYSSESSMFIESINVALSPPYTLEFQPLLRLRENSIIDVLVLYISWIIVCANYIFSLYTLPFSHFEDDGECSDDLTTNN
jgi:hypothetical protein